MDLDIADKGYVIVGGTAGMGRATAEVLVGEGASVAILGRERVDERRPRDRHLHRRRSVPPG
jgi:3-oxoacyl-[acyl-carrier protein] reductase